MKYYIYISPLKVDMLFEQLPAPLKKKIAAELKIDLKILSTTITSQALSETTFSKLELVTGVLKKAGEVGDLTNPKEYFAGELDMAWGQPELADDPDSEKVVVFAGATNQQLVGLVGSKAHMLGEVGNPVHAYYSDANNLRMIAQSLPGISPHDREATKINMKDPTTAYAGQQSQYQRVEFLAKTFLAGAAPDYYSPYTEILFGSPLYVAFAKKFSGDDQTEKQRKSQWWKLSR